MMQLLSKRVVFLSIFMIFLIGCGSAELPAIDIDVPIVGEQPIVEIPLTGPVSEGNAEISGMSWYGDWLILLPQYPSVVGDSLYALPKSDIDGFLDGRLAGPLAPVPIPLEAPTLETLPNFEGLEGVAFNGDSIYFTIETDQGVEMAGYLVSGTIEPDLSRIVVATTPTVIIPAQATIDNYSEEAVLIVDGVVMTLYEANGSNVNAEPVAHQYDLDINNRGTISFPNIEYRITDATEPDENGRFWVTNYIYSGSINKLRPAPDPLVMQFGVGETHNGDSRVERLVELAYSADGITLTDQAPIILQLRDDGEGRNWEGVARYKDGFLIATDKFPETILAYVAAP